MEDGSPQSSTVWVDTDGEHVIINTRDQSVKAANLRRDPRVAVTVFNRENPYEQLSIRGRAVSISTEGGDEHIDRMAKKYMDKDSYPYKEEANPRVIVMIVPERISGGR